ncbi:hypothetical protein [Spiroplasma endosymbiont of Dilophus febrilis]|uniref:hypothetical protein n=1 Tax=Spiroplasma endosymbiont of Dilophus febrilis TaxID=3066292 RepID=UPI00313B7A97
MKNIIKSLILSVSFITPILSLTSCSDSYSNQHLEIKYDDMHNEIEDYEKLTKIALKYLFSNNLSECGVKSLGYWRWELKNKYEVKGTASCGSLDTGWIYWTVTIKKNHNGLFVDHYEKEEVEPKND